MQFGFLKVVDDDSAEPVLGANTNLLQVMVGGVTAQVISGWGTTGVIYRVFDNDLTNAANSNLVFSFNAYDASGVNRGTDTAGTNMNISIAGFATNNVANFNAAKSSAATIDSTATSVWQWATAMSDPQVSDLYDGGTSNRLVTADIPDADSDRAGNSLWKSNQQFGFIRIEDDDTNRPSLSGFDLHGAGLEARSRLAPGDVWITGFNADGTDDFSFVTFVDIAPTTVLYITDRGCPPPSDTDSLETQTPHPAQPKTPAHSAPALALAPAPNGHPPTPKNRTLTVLQRQQRLPLNFLRQRFLKFV